LVDIGFLQQLAADRIKAGPPESTGFEAPDMGTVHSKNPIDPRHASGNS
jgi:hypothetical protein